MGPVAAIAKNDSNCKINANISYKQYLYDQNCVLFTCISLMVCSHVVHMNSVTRVLPVWHIHLHILWNIYRQVEPKKAEEVEPAADAKHVSLICFYLVENSVETSTLFISQCVITDTMFKLK